MIISVNLLGLLIRGIFSDPKLTELNETGSDFIKKEIEKSKSGDAFYITFTLLLNILFFIALYKYWNVGVVLVAGILMLSRLPDLLWELKNGRKLSMNDANLLPKNALYYMTSFSWLAEVPLLYYSLYII